MLSHNKKVERLLQAMAVVMKDEDDRLIRRLDDVINDRFAKTGRDGYAFDFVSACWSYRSMVQGKSW